MPLNVRQTLVCRHRSNLTFWKMNDKLKEPLIK